MGRMWEQSQSAFFSVCYQLYKVWYIQQKSTKFRLPTAADSRPCITSALSAQPSLK